MAVKINIDCRPILTSGASERAAERVFVIVRAAEERDGQLIMEAVEQRRH